MFRLTFSFLTVLLLCSEFFAVLSQAEKCRPKLTADQRCDNPPVEREVTLTSYLGKWYQTYISGSAIRFTTRNCVTANYTQVSDSPFQIGVLNCELPVGGSVPECVRANATKRPGAKFDSQLQVQFFPQLPPQKYSIAALIGFPNYGYQAAAVYDCNRYPPKFEADDGFFIISRTPYAPFFVLNRLIKKLRCNGYKNISIRSFKKSSNAETCKYFDGPASFKITDPDMPPSF